jgi:hypothetical protein
LVKKENYEFFWSFEYICQKDNDKIEQFNCHILSQQQDLSVDYTGSIDREQSALQMFYFDPHDRVTVWKRRGRGGGNWVILGIRCLIKNSSLSSIGQWINHAKLYKKESTKKGREKETKGQWLRNMLWCKMHLGTHTYHVHAINNRLGGTHNVCMTILGSHLYSNFYFQRIGENGTSYPRQF